MTKTDLTTAIGNLTQDKIELKETIEGLIGALDSLVDIQKVFGLDSNGRKILRVRPEDWTVILNIIKKAKKS